MIFVLILAFLDLSSAQIIQQGQCDPDIQLATNFNDTEFYGRWYVVASTSSNLINGDCSYFEFANENNAISLYKRSVRNNFLEELSGTASLQAGTAKLSLTTTSSTQPTDFWILLTDPDLYALGYSCENLGTTQRSITIWQLGRESVFEFELIKALMNVTLNNLLGITLDDLNKLDHSEMACAVLPQIPEGESVVLPGQCDPNVSVVENFDVEAFTGVWHEIASYYSPNALGDCPRAEYTLAGNVVNVVNSQVVNQALDTVSGTATLASTDGSGRLTVRLEIAPGFFTESTLLILATDYSDYAVSYVCVDLPDNQKQVTSWIVSRTRQLSANATAAVAQVINSQLDLNTQFFIPADQSDAACFYFPDPVPKQPVIFRGQCDESIPAMANFDPERYMGIWHDIESYPSEFQEGACNNAEYELRDGVVDVYNTQVIEQQLDTIRGVARLASTDGSAKLVVSFPIEGTNQTTETNYWVLDTDYSNYALVYSCANINEDERRVWSWKLSRRKQLTVEQNNLINQVIATTPVLDQRYYEMKDQSVEGCFYFPEPQGGVPVVFPGQCDENIPVVQTFNLEEFAGTWYEVQAYPKEQQSGQCIGHAMTSSMNVLNLQSSSVTDQQLQVTTGTISFASTDGSAKLVITINNGVQIPYWILRTDYSKYALAYACENDGEDFRRIYSWKLSRETQLSNNSINEINIATSDIVVLDDRYFEDIDHSDRACFYLPDIPAGEPFIIDGQCDTNIQGIANFDAGSYLGRWRLIESYASEFQTGTCSDATYSLGSDNTVVVVNSEVVNQNLVTITGSAVVSSTDNSGKLLVTFPGAPEPIEYIILDTDYSNYSLVYSCSNINNQQRRIWSWKMSRSRELTETAIENINRVIDDIDVLNNRFYEVVNQSDDGCFYFPTYDDPNTPVIFRGKCDPNVNVVRDFDAQAYMGKWYDISSYPSVFQSGSCNTAEYTLVGGTVDVFNTQVINETLDTINGVARISSTDGSAKLVVNFPIENTNLTTETDYWVLATDYISYSLVYTCVDIPEDESRQVWSWKLSRSRQLTENAVNNINTAINAVQVLDNRYYVDNDHSDEGCFYYPEPEAGVPVVFPGLCDSTIQAVPNFNMESFSGDWYEIEAYPKEFQPGQCVSHEYTSGTGNTLNLVSTNVNNETLGTSSSVLRFASVQDTSGRLELVTTSNGAEIVIPFWIIATDYNRYALAYSCVDDVANNQRTVYSWKLSRSKELSTIDRTLIDAAINNVQVLDNKYFEPIDQSDDACFYLPVHVPGQPVIFPGQCDENITVIQDFNAAGYLNRWRLIESYPNEFQDGDCIDATYTLNDNGSIDVYNTQVINQELDTIVGYATFAVDATTGKLLVYFPDTPFPAEYWVLDTDYDTFALVYSCFNLNTEQRRVTSWKMSRTAQLSLEAEERIERVMERIPVLNSRYFEPVDQSDAACFYYPEATGQPVVFRGQCDPNVNVVRDFDAQAYMGKWYDISSYPSVFQNGSCNTAEYTLVGGTVDVFNTQVIDETLDTINGVARIASTDGSAKLVVNFPIENTNLTTETDYWVLATDYISYSLVYTCVDIPEDESRQVWSWKLSRSRQLTENAVNNINTAINAVQVLDNRYYVDNDHSDEGCFYYPEVEAGVPVVFPGLCDSTIQAVPNFNMESFSGDWYEIEAYPKEFQPGQCVSHEYTSGTGNTLNLVSTNVNNETLGTTSSVLRFASVQDTSGRLELVTTSNGTEIVIPFWIIATDYNRYALAYSCVDDVANNQRTVYSWKLSRSKELSTIDRTLIDAAINNVQVLDNKYFEPIDQSDDACFYLPVHVPGQPVIFPGQCDENITVIQDFNAAGYLNRWRLIESYPNEFQDGDCIDATYTLNNNGSIDVYNTQVINQELDTIVGYATFAVNASTGKLLVYFPDTPFPAEYWVLDTDYDTFALVYSCFNINTEQRRVTSWKMSRTAQLSLEAEERIERVMERIPVLNSRYFEPVDQSDAACFYYPEATGQPVVFRGQCDPNVNVVRDFDAQAYMGKWYDISSYPSVFQNGSCNTAEYTLVGDTVDVFNTQVIDETLDTINGVARIASTDGSAKLVVNFPIENTNLTTETDYWVLATDYISYSLVYTCVDIPEDESRQVWSWKLSRSRQLTENAVNNINTAINAVQVLDNRYYVDNDHSDEGCFYYPEPEAGVPVVFPGLCDSTIQAVPNFNMESFSGDWYEIEAYPKEFQPGQCVSHEYTSGTGNTLNLVSTNVNNETLGTSSSVLRFASVQDTSGRLELVTTSNGAETVIPFWIIDTDYSRYALAYSCVNDVPNNRRAVYSWKLSRSKGLSAIDNNFINTAMNDIQVLDNMYFETIDQTDDACFYLPEYVPGQTVTFPGQCDQNIRVVQNFNATAYQGRWRMIETYPSDFQGGDCSDATYTINEQGSVDVYNTQVISQNLDTVNGNAVLATTDGSGKLLVTFPDAPFASEYWILDTDYDNFALVYSCFNVNSEERRVWSWKLSRTTSLSTESQNAINAAVDSINVLNDRYYERIDHSDDACFYYPIPDGNPVIFRGQCDESIEVVQNFDAVAYMGKWYDLESYPVAFQDGTCPTATYELTGDGVSVYNTQVVAQELDFIYGQAQLASTDGSAKLLVTFPIAGTDIMTPPSPYWVLDTDYSSFSLVYSCVNVDEEHRRVSSWKLSREWNLNQTAVDAINAAIARVPVLSQDYYVTRGHDEESCFYYPDNEGGPVVLSGSCDIDSINIVSGFDVNAFSGSWYEVERYPSELQSGDCVANVYEVVGTNSFDVTMSIVDNERTTVVTGPATVSDNRGILDVNLSNGEGVSFAGTMFVVDVEYNDFALLYACADVGNSSRQLYSWKLSRSQEGLSTNANERIEAIVNNTVDLFSGYYEETDQTLNGCFYYPEYEGEPSIDLIGPCDETIQAKQDFDAEKYLGQWYEIASYPQLFQFGECARAIYSLGDDVVDVFNTQVFNRTLDTMTGTAVVASTDGSGLLSVTFELAGGIVNVANYYVLETDYESFALVYSCRNLDNGNRQVTSWKLSRGPTLSSEAEEIMKPIIDSTQGLLEEYYQPTSQTEDSCFYIPEVNTNEAPLFRGRCEEISGMNGFDPQRYEGWWHEIERYPVDGNVGDCISSTFSAVGNQYQVVDTSVFDVVAESSTSTVTVTSDGRLTKTYSDGRVEDVWVLATDYDSYSLLYSCENIPDSEYMRVWSAKHSKARSLTQAAQYSMAPLIAANRVLEPHFYLAVNQSDDACFHYPEQSGDQVILPGQCDENIPVQQQFDPAQYTGTWYQIERYPQIHESGSCVGARYTLDEDTGVVTVLNWQVIEDALDTVTGTATVNSTDGSAKLVVNLPIRDGDDEENPTMVSMWLYVLETNYLSYSVAYSCVNVGDFHRSVGVWKLSRTRSMLEADVTTINALISRRPELHQPYFIQVEQSEDCDEPSSSATVYSSIIVLLLCVIVNALS
ncbi:uncharacterized protein LOC121726651 [Aricia agestis]|uniref:uncharacterized protein LOC121726651 n=1 Tax=Aricia agestis TaxID=91739 RepID=UPI001C202D7F|nr:uncharacterized protein LOC121726651 [Aricia agestis]